MANTHITTIKFTGQFDTSQITKGLQEIKKQMSNTHIGEDLRKQLETALSKVEVNIPTLEKMSAKGEYNTKDLEAFQKIILQVSKDMQALDKLAAEADFTKTFSAADTEKIKQFEKQLTEVENKLKNTRKEIIDNFSKTKEGQIGGKSNATLNGFIEQLISVPPDQIESKLDEIIKETEQQANNAVEKLQQDFQTKVGHKTGREGFIELIFGKDSGVSLKDNKTLGFSKVTGDQGAYSVYNKIRDDILALKQDASAEDINKILERYQAFVEEYFNVPEGKQSILANIITPEIVENLKQFTGEEGIAKLKALLGEEKLKLLADGEAEKLKLTQEQAAFLKQRLDELVQSKKLTADQAKIVEEALGGMNNKIQEGSEQIRKEKTQADALSATFGSLANRITNSISALTIFNKSIQVIHKAIASVKELDAAFTQIAIVSGQTNEQAWQMFDSFNKLAKQYSITTKDLAEGAKLFYQQGLNAADTMKMVEASTVSAALGEVTMTEAANTLTAAIQGYNESAAVAMDYTDKIAMVGAVSAADFNELSAAMEKTASSAYTAGIDFDHLLGYLGKMIEVTREAPANLGTAMKTIIARFEDMKKDPMAILEDGASANKVETALATIGVALRDATGEFRPLQDVFTDLGMKWQSLTRNQQAYIATVAAGSRQQSRFLALFNNFDRTLDLITESQNSAGAAAEQYATYQDSAAAATARLTAAWEEFYSKITNSQMIVTVINSLTKLVETMSEIGPVWSTAIATIGAHSINKVIKGNLGGKFLSNLINAELNSGENKITATISSVFATGIKEGIAKSKGEILTNGIKEAIATSASEGMSKGILGGIASIGSTIGATLPVLAGIIAALAIISALAWGISKAVENSKKENEKYLKNQSEKTKELREELNTHKKEKQNIEDNYEIYKKYENRIILTNEELEEQNKAVDNIKEQYKDLVVVTDELGKKNIVNTQQLEKHTKNLDKQIKDEKELIALMKLRAIQPTHVSKNLYGINNDKYMHDWTEEQLINVGFSQNEAQILDIYGEIYGNKDKTKASLGDFAKSLFGKELDKDSLFNMISNDMADLGYNINYNKNNLQEAFDMFFNMNDEALQNFADGVNVIKQEDKELDALQQIFQKYAQIMIEGKKILENSTKEYANSIAMANLNIEDSVLNNDISNILNNITQYDEDYFKTKDKSDQQIKKDVEDEIKKINEVFNEKVKESDKKPIHDFLLKLEDPTLSQTERNKIISDFETEYKYLDGALDNIINAHRNGTTQEQEQRNKLAEVFGINTTELDKYNFQEMNLIDRLFVNSNLEGEEKQKRFQKMISEPATKAYLNALKDFKTNVAEDPSIYKPIHDATIEMWEQALGISKEDATELFESTYGTFPEIALSTAKESFNKAKDNLVMEPTQSLTDEEYTALEASLGNSLKYYTEINEEGERYLTLAGRIAIFEKEREKYEKAIIGQMEDNLQKIEDIKIAQGLTKEEQNKQINNYKKENELLDKQRKHLEEIKKYSSVANALSTNVSYADTYYDAIDAIKTAEEEAKKSNGRINRNTAETLKSINEEYALYLNLRESGEGAYYELTEENAKKMRQIANDNYNKDLELEKQKLDNRITILKGELEIFQKVADGKSDLNYQEYQDEVKNLNKILEGNVEEANQELITEQDKYNSSLTMASTYATQYQSIIGASLDALGAKANALHNTLATVEATDGSFVPYDGTGIIISNKNSTESQSANNASIKAIEKKKEQQQKVQQKKEQEHEVEVKLNKDKIEQDKKQKREAEKQKQLEKEQAEQAAMQADAQVQVERINNEIAILEATKAQLKPLAPDLEDLSKGGGKAADELEKLNKVVEDLNDALEDLDDLLVDINRDLKDINVDYNPFTDLFEAWEHEWDYYYNIKRLIQQIEDQGKYIDGIISADYTTADQKIAAEQAKVGRLLAAMAANDAYIESLRTGMSQTALELMDEFGEYYKINPDTGQLYQHDTSLNEINNTINQRRQEIYELQKLQNEKENDLSLENAKLDALEKEKSAYEDILSTVESQLDSLRDDDDIIANVSQLESEQANIKAKITLTDESIDVLKGVVRNIEDEIQEIEIDVTLKEQSVSKLEEYVDKMEDKVSEYEEYWENLNSTIAEQQELLQSITEEYQKYVDTAISTEQDLYNAIIENYQNEINQKKKQYDELKKLDNDYLASVKDSINEERKARDDSNKQKSYQQSLQRAQLLQQDTSGAYRAELAQLNKDIEQQRQDLYDDLVDKQVEALEKEIEKRHELYDKEVAALEERLAYMQENAILLWEMVNNIVAEGSENMMATLENTTAYINSNELAKEKQRKTWEYNVKKTFDGVQNKTIDMLNDLIEAGNEYIKDKLPEVGTAVDEYTQTYEDAAHVIVSYNELLQNNMWSLFGGTGNEGAFQTILNSFMTTWNNTTNTLTGYSESWQAIVEGLRSATEGNIEALRNMNNQGGSIKELDKALRDSARELYEDFLEERRRYRDELNGLIDTIRVEITDAIKAAADAIRGAANSLQVNPNKDNGGTSGSTDNNGPSSTASSGGGGGTAGYKGWTAWFRIANYYGDGKDYVYQDRANFSNATYETLYNSWNKQLESMRKKYPGSTSWQFTPFATGGFADFTGPAWLDGTKSQPEAVLNPKQTHLFTSMVNSLEKASNNSNINSPLGSSYNIGDINTTIQVDKLDNQTDINRLARQVEDKIVKDIRNRIPVSVTKGV